MVDVPKKHKLCQVTRDKSVWTLSLQCLKPEVFWPRHRTREFGASRSNLMTHFCEVARSQNRPMLTKCSTAAASKRLILRKNLAGILTACQDIDCQKFPTNREDFICLGRRDYVNVRAHPTLLPAAHPRVAGFFFGPRPALAACHTTKMTSDPSLSSDIVLTHRHVAMRTKGDATWHA